MFKSLPDLHNARILISNDDGIHGPGLEVMETIAHSLSDDVWVVVPETEQSGAGHSLSLHRPLRIRKVSERKFAVDGTPTDSVLLAVNHILKNHRPNLLLSGVNRGANLADDVTYSGTVAAAMEGTLLGIPSIAMSQVFSEDMNWAAAAFYGAEVVQRLVAVVVAGQWQRNTLMNVNFPSCAPNLVKGFEVAIQGRRKLGDGLTERLDPRDRPYIWIGPQRSEETPGKGTDIAAIADNRISITPLSVGMTDFSAFNALTEIAFPQE